MSNIIQLSNINKSFDTSKRVRVLKKISFNFKKGKIYSLMGPSGSGKEAASRYIHENSKQSSGDFIVIDCSTSNQADLDRMLFGYEANDGSNNIGAFEKANGGSIFLDEVSELSLELQSKLLKVLVESSLSKVGSNKKIDVDLRFISSTSSDLIEKIKNQSFREDLFHRLNVVPIKIPNLNERIEDIPILAEHFSEKLSLANGLSLRKFSNEALTFLQGMTWPGNIRQLRNLIERVLILGNSSELISSEELILSEVKPQDSNDQINLISTELANMSLREAREIFERDYLILQINRFGGNISKTAAFVEMERSALHRKLKSLGINSGQKN